MDRISYSAATQNLDMLMERVCEGGGPLAITRPDSGDVVLISMDDYQAFEETVFLLRSPRNALRIMQSVIELDNDARELPTK